MGIKQFTQEIHGMPELQAELKKMNADSNRNFIIGLTGIIIAVLSLVVALFKG